MRLGGRVLSARHARPPVFPPMCFTRETPSLTLRFDVEVGHDGQSGLSIGKGFDRGIAFDDGMDVVVVLTQLASLVEELLQVFLGGGIRRRQLMGKRVGRRPVGCALVSPAGCHMLSDGSPCPGAPHGVLAARLRA